MCSFMPGWMPSLSGASAFPGGNQSHGSILEFLQHIASFSDSSIAPTAGGTLSINSQSLGSYDYVIKYGDQTISSFTASDWFTSTQDSRAAIIIVKGNLTINAGQTLIPSVRKLFTAIYVTGDLTINGTISMSARGADHSASGSNITAQAIRLATGTFDGVTNPQVPSSGGGGGGGATSVNNAGAAGTGGSAGGTGGGGGGAKGNAGAGNGGAGVAGTSFSGGSAGGGSNGATAGAGGANGGAGGDGNRDTTGRAGGGGAGNPGGAGRTGTGFAEDGDDGTGGIIYIAVKGTLLGSGTVSADGADGGSAVAVGGASGAGGGGSGGGSATIQCAADSSSLTVRANGGTGGTGSGAVSGNNGGNGGNGTARILEAAI